MNDWSPFLGLPLWVWLFVLPSVLALAAAFAGPAMARAMRPVWRALDAIYVAGGVVAALFLVTILGLIVAQMIARWTGTAFPGSTNYAGYAMAGASFFALAYAMTRGAHIRVAIFLNINPFLSRWLDVAALFVAAVTATYFARFAVKATILSEMLNDRTQGQDRLPDWLISAFRLEFEGGTGWSYTPIWIPQLVMSAGAILLAICLWDLLIRTLATRERQIVAEAME
ncbi:TRAP transporter small permease [Jannaschia aquimarina]|uniref:TRAP transporter small permease protein n=1 Tax=Jannaschia aquimarina TaxID=935700 RepID=A0A0D1EJY5_9RHOB|nr:TRAP transporter small permease subunit [Jannaschia aquimarina]KIT17874.1 Tripartite ATP-independent periplasmic transporter, DctQ component [Jannaschia aquimarina]SNS55837.1 TRAP-type C4-dicarboxylate transport system, small permease component [Jannaschia aquimarina]